MLHTEKSSAVTNKKKKWSLIEGMLDGQGQPPIFAGLSSGKTSASQPCPPLMGYILAPGVYGELPFKWSLCPETVGLSHILYKNQ